MWPFRRNTPHPADRVPINPTDQNQPPPSAPQNHSHNEYDWPFSVRDQRVMQALAKVPRHRFIPEPEQIHAHENRALPIGRGQTISQPYIVALMTELLNIKPQSRILEVGTGSGYQTAILAELSNHIDTVEIIPDLSRSAQHLLKTLGYHNIHYHLGDGSRGWPDYAPYDGIIVTCVTPELPLPLWDQLAQPHGRLVIPISTSSNDQQLVLYQKNHPDPPTPEPVCPVRFVPMTHVNRDEER